MSSIMTDKLKSYYKRLYQNYGRKAQAVQHTSYSEQCKRFEVLCELLEPKDSVIDLGCGLGHMLEYLREIGHEGLYLGLDFVSEFIESNKKNFIDDESAQFNLFDLNMQRIPRGYDQLIVCGVFNNIMEDNEKFMKALLLKMYSAAEKAVSFNMMSTYVEFFDENLHYFDPINIFDFCKKELSPLVSLRHDYALGSKAFPYEFTIHVKKV